MQPRNEERLCTATTRSGRRCTNYAIKGGNVCRMHGGSAPQVIAKAKQRLLKAADPAAATLVEALDNPDAKERRMAAIAILDRAGIPAKAELDIGQHNVEVSLVDRLRAALNESEEEDEDDDES